MSESGDFTPAAHWAGYDFASARRSYVSHAARSYTDAVTKGVKAASLVPASITTDSEQALVIACDVTGSMQEWPATIFSKLPYLEHEAAEYMGSQVRTSFAAIGDLHSDKYPLQVSDFVEGLGMKDALEKLVIERGGGGTSEESYELCALYYAHNCHMPNVIRKPVFVFIGDEGVYPTIAKEHAETLAKVLTESTVNLIDDIFEKLKEKFNVYVIRKPYGGTVNAPTPDETRIRNQWIKLLGEENVIGLPDPNRVVDVIFGILAKESNKVEYFVEELKERQGKDVDGDKKIEMVMKSLKTLHSKAKTVAKKLPPPSRAVSVTKRKTKGAAVKSVSLLDD